MKITPLLFLAIQLLIPFTCPVFLGRTFLMRQTQLICTPDICMQMHSHILYTKLNNKHVIDCAKGQPTQLQYCDRGTQVKMARMKYFRYFCVTTNKIVQFQHLLGSSIRVSWSFATKHRSKVGPGMTVQPPFSTTYVHYIITVFLNPLNWSIERRYMCVKQYAKK